MNSVASAVPPDPNPAAPARLRGLGGLRSRLLLLVAVAVLPMLGLLIHAAGQTREVSMRLAEQQLSGAARLAEEQLAHNVRGAEQFLRALGEIPYLDPRTLDAGRCAALLGRYLNDYQRFANLAIADAGGTVVCSGTPAKQAVNAADRDFFRAALASERPAAGRMTLGRISNRGILPLGYALRAADGAPVGVAILSLDLGWYARGLIDSLAIKDAAIVLFDADGRVLARHPNNQRYAGHDFSASPLFAALRGRGEGTVLRGEGLDGIDRLLAAQAINYGSATQWLAVSVPAARQIAPLEALRERSLAVFSLLAGLAAALAFWLGEFSLRRPLRRIADAARRLGGGDASARVGADYLGEIGELGRDFDRAAEQLAARQGEIDSHRRELETRVAERTRELATANARLHDEVDQHAAAERELAEAARFDTTHNRALSLFTATLDRRRLLDDLLALLAGQHPFPAGAYYAYDEWRGTLKREASRGLPDDGGAAFAIGEGLVGQAAAGTMPSIVDWPAPATGFALDAGVASAAPAAVALCPVGFLGRCFGVLALAASRPLSARETDFLARLTAQLGVTLHNLNQFDDLKHLAQQLRARGEEITQKNAQLEEAARTKSEFLANMSHELRTPLNAIIGFSEAIRDGLMGEVSAQQREYVGDILAAGEHLLSLINDILDLSKVEAGKLDLHAESVELRLLFANALTLVREKALARHLRLDLDIADDLPPVWADPRRVKQIVYNLLSNAVKFTPDGGAIAVRVGRVAGADGDALEIVVSDTGIGIAAADQARLFQPFVQIDSSLTRSHAGTGLGLVMVKRLAELHGGDVSLDSAPGRGSTFRVRLPWRAAPPAVIAAAEATAITAVTSVPDAGAPLALIVEDDAKAAALISRVLAEEGFRTRIAIGGAEALRCAAEETPDVITLDILMPGIDGWEILARLREDARLAAVPVVIISVAADAGRGAALGAARVLQKPVARADLQAALADLGFATGARCSASVLVIDDDPQAVDLMTRFLQHDGCRTIAAFGGAEGIEQARAQRPDLLILDLMMPEISGFQVMEALRADAATAEIPIVVVTAKHLTANDRAEIDRHAVAVLHKAEFRSDRFIAEVRRALRSRPRTLAAPPGGKDPRGGASFP